MERYPFPDESLERIVFDKIFDEGDKVTISFQPTERTRVCVFVPRGNEPVFDIVRERDGVSQHFEE